MYNKILLRPGILHNVLKVWTMLLRYIGEEKKRAPIGAKNVYDFVVFLISFVFYPPFICISWFPQLANLWLRSWISPKYADNSEIIDFKNLKWKSQIWSLKSQNSLKIWRWTKEGIDDNLCGISWLAKKYK